MADRLQFLKVWEYILNLDQMQPTAKWTQAMRLRIIRWGRLYVGARGGKWRRDRTAREWGIILSSDRDHLQRTGGGSFPISPDGTALPIQATHILRAASHSFKRCTFLYFTFLLCWLLSTIVVCSLFLQLSVGIPHKEKKDYNWSSKVWMRYNVPNQACWTKNHVDLASDAAGWSQLNQSGLF